MVYMVVWLVLSFLNVVRLRREDAGVFENRGKPPGESYHGKDIFNKCDSQILFDVF
jgi:hypothetical protein